MGGWDGTVHFKKRGIEWRRYILFFTLSVRNVRARAGVGACRFGAAIPGGAEFPVLLQPTFPHIRLSQPTKGPPRRFEGAQPKSRSSDRQHAAVISWWVRNRNETKASSSHCC